EDRLRQGALGRPGHARTARGRNPAPPHRRAGRHRRGSRHARLPRRRLAHRPEHRRRRRRHRRLILEEQTAMAIEGVFYVRIAVADLARSKRFYADQLGWKLQTDEPYVAGLWFGSGYVVCSLDPEAAAKPRDPGMRVAVRVDDIDAQHKQLTE